MIKIIKGMDKKLLILTVILFGLGLVMVYSASNVTAYMLNDTSPERYFLRQLLFVGTGIILALIISTQKTKRYYFWSTLSILVVSVIILLIAIYGAVINGATGWIGYNGFGIQPSEFVKVLIIPFYAMYYEKYRDQSTNFLRMFFPVIISFIITFLIILQNDYGTAFIFLMLSIIMFFFSTACKKFKAWFLLTGLFVGIIGSLVLFLAGDKVLDAAKWSRFDYSSPCEKYQTTGNQLCNGYIAINGGGLFGKGFGNSTQKYLYLPEAHTDFIFAIIVEELGVVGGLALILLYGLLLVQIILIGKKSPLFSHKFICFSVAIYIFLHIAINLGGVLGLIPVTGIPLPFMSYGGSFCYSIMFALVMVQRISYETSKNRN